MLYVPILPGGRICRIIKVDNERGNPSVRPPCLVFFTRRPIHDPTRCINKVRKKVHRLRPYPMAISIDRLIQLPNREVLSDTQPQPNQCRRDRARFYIHTYLYTS